MVLLGGVVLAGSTALMTWWTTTLMGLPDVGDPFDVAAFTEAPVADDDNAYVLYREAIARWVPSSDQPTNFDWPAAGPVEKAWLERNREAIGLWRRGTERTKALYVPLRSMTIMTQLPVLDRIRWFMRLAKLEGGRLEAEGDMEGAWQWYRAIFRCSRHLGHLASWIERLVGLQMHALACRELTRWSADPRVGPALLRKALDAAIADYALTGPVSDNFKVEYLAFLKTYDDPELVWKCFNDQGTVGPGPPAWFARDLRVFSVTKRMMNEPERSRRVARLVYANLLAVCDRPPDRRPPVAATLNVSPAGTPTKLVDLYEPDAAFPDAAKALSPESIARWFDTTVYARRLMPAIFNVLSAIDRERATQANLVIALANRLYEIERGKPPATFEDLVGPYLKALPEGFQSSTEPKGKP
jgi:hypothetical protein